MTSLCVIEIAEFRSLSAIAKRKIIIPCMPLSMCFVSFLTDGGIEGALELLEMTLRHLFQARDGRGSGDLA